MNTENIIQEEVKTSLSEFGLNEEERKSYESLILSQIKDKTFEKEEELKTEITSRIESIKPSVKLLQQSRTKLMQENAKVLKEFEEYKKNNPLKSKDEEKDKQKDEDNGAPEWAKVLMEDIKNLKQAREEEKKQKTILEKKEAVLKALKPKYNKSFHTTIDVIANGFDFSKDDAENKFTEQISQLAKDNPAMLVNSDNGGKNKEKNNPFLAYKQDTDKAQEEFNKNLK